MGDNHGLVDHVWRNKRLGGHGLQLIGIWEVKGGGQSYIIHDSSFALLHCYYISVATEEHIQQIQKVAIFPNQSISIPRKTWRLQEPSRLSFFVANIKHLHFLPGEIKPKRKVSFCSTVCWLQMC